MAQNANTVSSSQAAEIAQGSEHNYNVAATSQTAAIVQGAVNE